MLKAIGIFITITAGAGIGFVCSLDLTRRAEGLKQLLRLGTILKGEIEYRHATLPEAMAQAAAKLKDPYKRFAEDISGEMKEYPGILLTEIFEKSMKKHLEQSRLDKEDRQNLCELGGRLGYLDRQMQIQNLEWFCRETQQELRELQATMPARKKVYQSLGIMGGLFLAVLIL